MPTAMVQQPNTLRGSFQNAADSLANRVDLIPGRDERQAREQANLNRQFEGAAGTNAATEYADLIEKGHVQHLNYRAVEGIATMDAAKQKALFEANTAAKAEGTTTEVMKRGLDKLNTAAKEVLGELTTTPAEWKVANLQDLENPGAPKEFDLADLTDQAKLDKFIGLNPEREGRFDAAGVKDDLGDNIKKLFDGVYGATLSTRLDTLIQERLNAGGPDSTALLNAVKGAIDQTVPGTTNGEVIKLVQESIKISMLRNPDKAVSIITALKKNGQIDLAKVHDFKTILDSRIVKFTVDELASDGGPAGNRFFFDSSTGAPDGPTAAQVKQNRQRVANQLINGTSPAPFTINIASAGWTDTVTVRKLKDNAAYSAKITAATIKVAAKPAAGTINATTFNTYKNNPFHNLASRFGAQPVKESVKEVTEAMAKNPSMTKAIFENVLIKGVRKASDASASNMVRHEAMAKAYRYIVDHKAGATNSASLEEAQKTLEPYSTPEGLLKETESNLFDSFVNKLTSVTPPPAVLAGLPAGWENDLQNDLKSALNQKSLDTNVLERLAMLVAAVPNEADRKELLAYVRAVADLEILKTVAESAAGSSTDPKYQQYLMALMNRFAYRDSGTPGTLSTTDQLTGMLTDLLYAKPTDQVALTININANPELKSYIQSLLPGAAVEQKIEVKGQGSTGVIYSKAHEVYGIVRRGEEAGELMALNGAPQAQIDTYLINNFGFAAGSPELAAASARLNELFNPMANAITLGELITAAALNRSTNYGTNYTNLERSYRHYIENGGNLPELLRNNEAMQANRFLQAVQSQANPELNSPQGGVTTEANRVLTMEEQRTAMLADYEALSGRSGLKGFWERVKQALPRVAKAAAFMLAGTVGMMFPAVAVPMGIAFGIMRGLTVFATVKNAIPLIRNAWASKNMGALGAAALAVGVNVAVNAFMPTPLGYGLTLLGETIGTGIYADRSLAKQQKVVMDAHAAYDTAWQTKLQSLNLANADDAAYLNKVLRSINQAPVTDAAGNVNLVQTVNAIKTQRDTAHTQRNMALLRSFSTVMEERMAAEAQYAAVQAANLKAKEMYDRSNQNIMAYALASTATKLGYGIGRGFDQGYEKAGLFGGIAGALGVDVGPSGEAGHTPENAESYTQIQAELEKDFDAHTENLGINNDSTNVVGVFETTEGDHYAVVDMDGNPNTVDALVDIDNMSLNNPGASDLDFSEVELVNVSDSTAQSQVSLLTGTPVSSVTVSTPPAGTDPSITSILTAGNHTFAVATGSDHMPHLYEATVTSTGGGAEIPSSYEQVAVIAEPGDNQWSMVEKLYRSVFPGHDDQWYWNKTANTIAEAGAGGIYGAMDANDGGEDRGMTNVDDKLTLKDLKTISPNSFARAEEASGTGVVLPGTSVTTIPTTGAVTLTGDPIDNNVSGTGLLIFDSAGEHQIFGDFSIDAGTVEDTSVVPGVGGTGGQAESVETEQTQVSPNPISQAYSNVTGYFSNEWEKFENAVQNPAQGTTPTPPQATVADDTTMQADPQTATGGISGASTSTTTVPIQNGPGDTFTFVDPGIGADRTISEDLVSKIVVSGGQFGSAMPPQEIDPSQVDVLSVTPGQEVVYRTADGQEVHATGTDIKFEFKGNEGNLVDASEGEQTFRDYVSNIPTPSEMMNSIASGTNTVNSEVVDTAREFEVVDSGITETITDIGSMIKNGEGTSFDPGFTGDTDAVITHTGTGTFNYVTHDTQAPAWLEAVAVTTADGSGNQVIPVENVYKFGPNYVEYRDLATNQIIRVDGTSVVGVGYTYDNTDPNRPIMNMDQTYEWKFSTETPDRPSIEKVSTPWWKDQTDAMLPRP